VRYGCLFLPLVLVLLAGGCDENESDFDFTDGELYRDAAATELVDVPAGTFIMGSDYNPEWDILDGGIDEPFTDEHPEHAVYLRAYRIEKTEVTNAQYRACVIAGGCDDPTHHAVGLTTDYYTDTRYGDYPMVNLTWRMAADYCAWRGRRLPTEAEWEKAARGRGDDRIYPWGWQEPTCGLANISIPRGDALSADAHYVETCRGFPLPVGYFPDSDSEFGALEMTGNVAEWTADWYDAASYDAALYPDNDVNPTGPATGLWRVVRGGGYASTAMFARVSYRGKADPETKISDIGFRCAVEAEE